MLNIKREIRKVITTISPVFTTKLMYKTIMKKKINLKEPQTFNEKINWLKLYKFPKDENVINCADKYKVREYIKSKGLDKYLVELYNSWDNADEIDWKKLPNKFVLKCNHGCAYNIICNDKNELIEQDVKDKLSKWLKEDFSKVSAELHYKKIKRKIICEKFLENEILDYKFFCFNGEPKYFYVSRNIEGDFHDMEADFFNIDGTLANFIRTDHKRFKETPKIPENLKEMISICKILAKDFPFVRVDLFNVEGKIYFSELTFTPCSGVMPINPPEADKMLGDLIDLGKYI